MDDEEDDELLRLPEAGSSIFGSDVDFEPEQEEQSVGSSQGLGAPPMAVASVDPTPLPEQSKAPNTSLGAALTLFTVAGGAVLGYRFGGWKGATGGVFVGGGLRNLWRAKGQVGSPDIAKKGSGIQQGIIGLAGLAAGAYLLLDKETKAT